MEDEIQYPGLVGAGISRAQKSPYDRSFEPGEATLEDVRANLVDMFLSGLGLVPGGALAATSPRAAGGRVRIGSKPYAEQRFPSALDVRVTDPADPAFKHYDTVRGLNRGHAAARARENWEGLDVLPLPELRVSTFKRGK